MLNHLNLLKVCGLEMETYFWNPSHTGLTGTELKQFVY